MQSRLKAARGAMTKKRAIAATTMSNTNILKVKVVLGQDIRSWRYSTQSTLSSLNEFVATSFNLSNFWLQYEDDEGDRLTLSSQNDFEDAFACAQEKDRKSLKIYVNNRVEEEGEGNLPPSYLPPSYQSEGKIPMETEPLPSYDQMETTIVMDRNLENKIRIFLENRYKAFNDRDFNILCTAVSDDIYIITKEGKHVQGIDALKAGVKHRIENVWNKIDLFIKQYNHNFFINNDGEICVSYSYRCDYEIKQTETCIRCILSFCCKPTNGWEEGTIDLKLRTVTSDDLEVYYTKTVVTKQQKIE